MAQRGIILITGANTGLGFQIVRALCSSDKAYDIILGGRSLAKVDAAIKSAVSEYPSSSSKLSPLQVDIEHDDSIKAACEEIESKFGRLDTLINNAGMHIPTPKLPKASPQSKKAQGHNLTNNSPQAK